MALTPGSVAPPIAGADLAAGPAAVVFYKVTCPVCQMAAPKVEAFERAYPGHVVGVGQDPAEKLGAFGERFGMSIRSVPDLPPYPASEAYRIEVVPTLFVVDDQGIVVEAVESWDRDGYNRASVALARLAGLPSAPISDAGDGLPAFRPG